jgi:hypothetical protein
MRNFDAERANVTYMVIRKAEGDEGGSAAWKERNVKCEMRNARRQMRVTDCRMQETVRRASCHVMGLGKNDRDTRYLGK